MSTGMEPATLEDNTAEPELKPGPCDYHQPGACVL